jgi:hypothetical protein
VWLKEEKEKEKRKRKRRKAPIRRTPVPRQGTSKIYANRLSAAKCKGMGNF